MKSFKQEKKAVLFLVGPTAVGKSALAVRLAKKINAQIISCDSMQIYKHMDILSAKPTDELRRQVKHFMIDIISPREDFNVALYRKKALGLIKKIHNSGKVPLFVGGSGLYMSAVVDGVFEDVAENKLIRKRLYDEARKKGNKFLHNRLTRVDSDSAAKIHPNDLKRIVRALEVYQVTGTAMSKLKLRRRGIIDDYDVKIFGLFLERRELYKISDMRVEEMFKKNVLDEARKLLKMRLGRTASKAIGIKELKNYLEGKYDINEAMRLLKRNTRHYAKRQFAWFKRDKRIIWVDAKKRGSALKQILSVL